MLQVTWAVVTSSVISFIVLIVIVIVCKMQSKRKKGVHVLASAQNGDSIEMRSNVNDDDSVRTTTSTKSIGDTDVTDDDINTAASTTTPIVNDDDADVTDALLSGQMKQVAKPNSPNTTDVGVAAISSIKLRHVSRVVTTKQRSDADSDASESDALNVCQRVDHIEAKTRELWPDFDPAAEVNDGALADQLLPLRLTTKD